MVRVACVQSEYITETCARWRLPCFQHERYSLNQLSSQFTICVVSLYNCPSDIVRAPKAPARPEAGGKELVVLQAKEERDLMDPIARGSRKNANFQVQMSVAAVRSASVSDTPPLPVRCRELLEAIRPQIENSVVEYLVDLVTEAPIHNFRLTVGC